MLRAPLKKIQSYRIRYVLIIITCFTFSTSIIIVNQYIANLQITGNNNFSETEREVLVAGAESLSYFSHPLIIGIPIIAGIFMLIYHIPSFASVGLSKTDTTRELRFSKFFIPHRGYTIKVQDVSIRITKKFSSLKGLVLQEFLLAIYLPKNYPETSRLYDFLVCEEIKYTQNNIILLKTINIRDIPFHIIRTKALLSVLQSGQKRIVK